MAYELAEQITTGAEVIGTDRDGNVLQGTVVRITNRAEGRARVNVQTDQGIETVTLTGIDPTDATATDLVDENDQVVIGTTLVDHAADPSDLVALAEATNVPPLADGDTLEIVHTLADGTTWCNVHHADGSQHQYRGRYTTLVPAPTARAVNGVVIAESFGTKGVQGKRTIDRATESGRTFTCMCGVLVDDAGDLVTDDDGQPVRVDGHNGQTFPPNKFPTDGPDVRIDVMRGCNTVRLVATGSSSRTDITQFAH